MNDAVVYTRLSAEREGSTETLEDQERVCRQLAAAKGLNVVAVFAEGAGVSAFSGVARPALDALHDHVRANRGTTVVAWELSRLTRKLTDLSGWVQLIEEHQLFILILGLIPVVVVEWRRLLLVGGCCGRGKLASLRRLVGCY